MDAQILSVWLDPMLGMLRKFHAYRFGRPDTYRSANLEKPRAQVGEIEIARRVHVKPVEVPLPPAKGMILKKAPARIPSFAEHYHILKHREGLPYEDGIGSTICGDTLLLEPVKYLPISAMVVFRLRSAICGECLQVFTARLKENA